MFDKLTLRQFFRAEAVRVSVTATLDCEPVLNTRKLWR